MRFTDLDQDLWNIGRFLGLVGFDGTTTRPKGDADWVNPDEDFKEMVRELRSTLRKDRKERAEGAAEEHVRRVAGGLDAGRTVYGAHAECVSKWIAVIRNKFRGSVLRRTATSTTYNGERISGLAPATEHNIMGKLYENEAGWMETIAGQLASQDAEAGMTQTASKVSIIVHVY